MSEKQESIRIYTEQIAVPLTPEMLNDLNTLRSMRKEARAELVRQACAVLIRENRTAIDLHRDAALKTLKAALKTDFRGG